MGIGQLIRRAFSRKERELRGRFERLARLPRDQAQKEFGRYLYDFCLDRAAAFVKEELARGDSPFRSMSSDVFFHEMLAVAFWLVDKEVSGGKKSLIPLLHDHYFRSFTPPEATPAARNGALLEKYGRYDSSWNDVTGHQDQFGLTVTQNIYGAAGDLKTRERTFWIITYAHNILDALEQLKRTWRDAGFKP
jgi:hypothetical protein